MFTSVCISLPSLHLVVCAELMFLKYKSNFKTHNVTRHIQANKLHDNTDVFRCTIQCTHAHHRPSNLRLPLTAGEGGSLTWATCCCIISAAGVPIRMPAGLHWWNAVENVSVHYLFNTGIPLASMFEGAEIFAETRPLYESGVFRKSVSAFLCTNTVTPVLFVSGKMFF